MTPFQEEVYRLVSAIPRGKVVSYGGVAALLGRPRAARAVGGALCELPDELDVPWWRVVNRNGEISIRCIMHGPQLQRALLESEGVAFDERGRISWKRFGWSGDQAESGVPGRGPRTAGRRRTPDATESGLNEDRDR